MAGVNKRTTLQIWGDVIFAIFLREIKSKFNDKLGVSWAVIQPVSFIFILSFIRGRLDGGDTHTMPSFVFIVYGMLIMQTFLNTMRASAGSIKRNKPLFAFRQVQPIASTVAIVGFEFLVKVCVIAVIVLAMYFLGIEIYIHDPLGFIVIYLTIWLLAVSVGILFALLAAFIPEVDKAREMMQRPLLFISGTFFSLQDLPRESWGYFDWNPILHAIELSRQAAYPTFGAVGVSQLYLNIVTLVFTFLALSSYRVYWKQSISR
ncbi:ABC transporter permease [Vibrio paucivorans]|uniref:Transport permease protein n=1 Tax=Vibrio paucivorans TaxID=2829489 RepID=A0A9X3CBR8_9VIBR|nr:ABC transporter permease [Vibrio paucivorans]MCW8332808.1 ABC transporter permease [Vibrio paucivorans]